MKILGFGILVAAIGFAPLAHADQAAFVWNGNGVSGDSLLTFVPNVAPPDPNPNCGTLGNNPCRTDPAGAFALTDITGTFTDATAGLLNATITGLVPINPANERDPTFDPLVPSSLSFIDYTTEANPGSAISYNDLFFPDGSPIDCAYPFFGTYLDVFGMAFTVSGGDTVVVWGDGNTPTQGDTYGVAVIDSTKTNLLDYQFSGINASVPEPSSVALLAAGLVAFGFARRRRT